MRNIVVVLLVAVSGLACAATPGPPSEFVGLWQFRDNTAWVAINPDGTAFQCRIAPGGTVYESEGRFVPPQSITWKTIWGTDEVTSKFDHLTLHGKWGDFAYHHTGVAMSSACSRPAK